MDSRPIFRPNRQIIKTQFSISLTRQSVNRTSWKDNSAEHSHPLLSGGSFWKLKHVGIRQYRYLLLCNLHPSFLCEMHKRMWKLT